MDQVKPLELPKVLLRETRKWQIFIHIGYMFCQNIIPTPVLTSAPKREPNIDQNDRMDRNTLRAFVAPYRRSSPTCVSLAPLKVTTKQNPLRCVSTSSRATSRTYHTALILFSLETDKSLLAVLMSTTYVTPAARKEVPPTHTSNQDTEGKVQGYLTSDFFVTSAIHLSSSSA